MHKISFESARNPRSSQNECHVQCHCCKKPGLFIDTPDGGDYTTCPFCGTPDSHTTCTDEEYERFTLINEKHGNISLRYCPKCNVLYDTSLVHAENGCTSSSYYSSLVKDFKHFENDTWVEYPNSMPRFEGLLDFLDNHEAYRIHLVCACDGFHYDCPRAVYKQIAIPCELKDTWVDFSEKWNPNAFQGITFLKPSTP